MKNTILIIDGSAPYREMLKAIVEKEGYRAELCSNGKEALVRIRGVADQTLAVILDLHMPEIDGISVIGNFRHHHPELPLIVITGSEDRDDEIAVRRLGVKNYIP